MQLTEDEARALTKLHGWEIEDEPEPWKYENARWWVYDVISDPRPLNGYRDYLACGETIAEAYQKAAKESDRRARLGTATDL